MVRNQWKIKRDGEILELKPIYYNPDKKELRIKGKIPVGIDFSSIVRQKLGFEKPDEHSLKTLQEIDGMDLETIIRFIFSNFGLSQSQISKIDSFKKAINDLSKKYDKTQAEEIINKCKVAIERVMNFLKKELGIVSVNILPSETVLVPISSISTTKFQRNTKKSFQFLNFLNR